MNGLNYLLQTNLYLLLFMGFYVLVLRNETFFRQNRFFLNTSIFLSFAVPFVNSDWFRDLFITQKVREAAIMPSQMIYDTIIVGVNEEASAWTVSQIISTVYVTGAIFLLIRLLVRLSFLKSNLRVEKGAAFSFFNTLVVDKEMAKVETIIDHEKVHMRQWHSADIIFIELAAIINWFNPVMYLYKKEIRHIHEFIADEEAANLMKNKSDYALLLFSNTLGVDPLHLSNNFFNKSLLKRRIIMLHKTKSRRTGLWKYGFSAPLFILMLIVSAATVKSEEAMIRPVAEKLLSPLETEISNKIMSALEIDKTASEVFKIYTEVPKVNPGPDAGKKLPVPDYSLLMRHIQKNIKYPSSARENNITGYVVAKFTIKDKKVSAVQIEKGLQKDIDDEVIRTLSLYKDDIDALDEGYFVAVNFNLIGNDTQADNVPNVAGENFVGQVTVTAMKPGTNTSIQYAVTVANPEKSLKLNEVLISGDNTVKNYAAVEVLPEFAGGLQEWGKYLTANLKYPKEARENKITGRVILAFIVEKDGSLSEIKVVRGIGGGADEEAVRVLKSSPNWRPGMLNGRPVRVAYTMPVFFQLAPNSPQDSNQNTVPRAAMPADVKGFASVEVLPEFAGGMAGWSKYLAANLKYPEQAKKDKITGRVIVGFIIEKDGSLSEIKVIRGIGGGLDEEAVRVVSAGPKWKPGIQDGRPVRVAYTMPISFQLGPNK